MDNERFDDMPEQPLLLPALVQNLKSGVGIALGRRVAADVLFSTPAQLVALMLLLLAIRAVADRLAVEAPAVYDSYGLNFLAASYLLDLLLLTLAKGLVGGGWRGFSTLVVGFAAALVPISVVSELLWQLEESAHGSSTVAWSLFGLLLFWRALVLVRLLSVTLGFPGGRAVGAGGLLILGICASLWVLPRNALWYTDYPDPQSRSNPVAHVDVQATYYAQPGLMQDSLSRLAPQRPGVTDLYLLALAGYAPEDVFLNEVEYVRRQFDSRYGTSGRSLILANNPATTARYPLASGPNLKAALKGIAARMDTREDLLFLFLTSHGSSDHRFILNYGPLRLHDLTPQQLRDALDAAGIRWRVILVSACYSGGFLKPLETPDTLVITAAAADRSSFGCGSDSDFTYFGTAYFKQALPQQPDFIRAFDIAKQWVSDKERKDHFIPSQPQRFVGRDIARKLDSFYVQPGVAAALHQGPAAAPSCSAGATNC